MVFIHGSAPIKRLFIATIFVTVHLQLLQGLQITFSSYQQGRFLAGVDGVSEASRPFDHDTVRADPLDGLKKYRGGYDITNKHYWSSTAYTGIYGYAIAVLLILCGLGYGAFLLAAHTCCRKTRKLKKSSCHKQCHLWPILFVVALTLLAVVACGLVLGGNVKFHARAKRVIDIIIDTADNASDTIYKTTGAMKDITLSLRQANGNAEATGFLASTSESLDTQASDIQRQASKNRRAIDKGIKIVYIVTTVMFSLTLAAAIALLIFGIQKFPRTLHGLIAVCWILTVLCWAFFGIYFFLHNFAGDTCTALESFQIDPYNNSLSSILPCDELLSAKLVLKDISSGIYNIVDEVNKKISTDYGNLFQICNPFSPPPLYEYQPGSCPNTSIQIGDISQVLRMVACPYSEGKTCKGGILIPATEYNTMEAYSTSVQKLLDVYPGMESLVECQTVKDAFATILRQHCTPLKRYSKMVWASLVFLSVTMTALVLVWIIGSHRQHSHRPTDSSVRPHDPEDEGIKSGTTKPTRDDSAAPSQG